MKKILIIGAGFLQSSVIRRAKEMGYYTLAVDGNSEAVGFAFADEYKTINIVDKDACLEYAQKNGINGVLTAATDYGVLTASHIAKEMGLPGISYSAAQLIKNKYEFRKVLFEAKADDTGSSHEVKNKEDIIFLKDKISYPVMVKPCDGSGSRGASRVDSEHEFEYACRQAMENSLVGRATVEPFIDGREYGVESFVCDGEVHILAVMKKWMTEPPYYAELGHAIPSGLPDEVENKIKCCVEKAIRALKINFGSVNMDLLLTKSNSVHIIDIGARMGGNTIGSHIIPLGTGIDYMGNMIRAAVGDKTDFAPVNTPANVATRILALSPGKVKHVPNMEELFANENIIVWHHISEGDEIHEYHTNLDGCGYVICTADTSEKAKELAVYAKHEIDNHIIRD